PPSPLPGYQSLADGFPSVSAAPHGAVDGAPSLDDSAPGSTAAEESAAALSAGCSRATRRASASVGSRRDGVVFSRTSASCCCGPAGHGPTISASRYRVPRSTVQGSLPSLASTGRQCLVGRPFDANGRCP